MIVACAARTYLYCSYFNLLKIAYFSAIPFLYIQHSTVVYKLRSSELSIPIMNDMVFPKSYQLLLTKLHKQDSECAFFFFFTFQP